MNVVALITSCDTSSKGTSEMRNTAQKIQNVENT